MIRITRRLPALRAGWVLALLLPFAFPAAHAATPFNGDAAATAFVHELAAGQFKRAESHLNARMRAHATPAKLKNLWQYIQKEFGAYAKTDGSDAMSAHGHPMVIVHTVFKRQAVGLAVFFDHAHQIAGLRVVPIR